MNDKKKTKEPFLLLPEIEQDLKELAIRYEGNEWLCDSFRLSTENVYSRILVHRNTRERAAISKQKIVDVLGYIENVRKERLENDVRLELTYDPNATDKFEELAHHISQDKYESMYPVILKQIVWTVKRRMNRQSDYCPIFVNFYGPAGAGKTEFLKAFFSVFPSSMKSRASQANELFNDERQTFRFVENFVLVMDELTGLDKSDLNKLKNQIDCEKVVYRVLGHNKTAEGRNNAQLVGTSNTRIKNTIINTSASDIRKWAEIDFYKYPDDEIPAKMVQPLIQFDWLNLWRSVDENGPSPFQDGKMYDAFKKWTSDKCCHENANTDFVNDSLNEYAGKFVTYRELYKEYEKTIGPDSRGKMSRETLIEHFEKNSCKRHKRNYGHGLLFPAINSEITLEE